MVKAACRFALATGKRAAIGALADLERIILGQSGTTVTAEEPGIVYACDRPGFPRMCRHHVAIFNVYHCNDRLRPCAKPNFR
jgi:hypothetical protein